MPEIYDDGKDDGLKEDGTRVTPSIHTVAEYAGISFNDALDLPCDMYKNMLRNALIKKMSATETGRRYLDIWRRCQITQMRDDNLDFFKSL